MSNAPREIVLDALPHQVAFWTDDTDGARIALVGGLGSGKTRALVIKRLRMQVLNPGCDSMLVEPTYPMVRDILVPALEQILMGELGLPVRHNKADQELVWPPELGGGKTLLRSAEDPDRLAGSNLGDVGFDEPGQMVEKAWNRGSLRARDPRASVRQVYATGTPEGITWFARLFDDPKPPYRTIRAKTWHPSIGTYPLEVARTYAGSQHELDAYLDGKFVPMFTGRCYPAFDRTVHVSENGHLGYNPSLELVLACDFNVDAMRWLVCQKHFGQFQVLDEIALGENGSVQEAAREFVRRYNGRTGTEQRHLGAVRVTGDASGNSRTQTGDVCYQRLLAEVQPHWRNVVLDVPGSNPLQRDRVETVNHHLAGAGLKVLIHPRCTELILDLQSNRWRPGTAEIEKPKHPPENKRTHAADAFGYALWLLARVSRPTPQPVKQESEREFLANDQILGARW